MQRYKRLFEIIPLNDLNTFYKTKTLFGTPLSEIPLNTFKKKLMKTLEPSKIKTNCLHME